MRTATQILDRKTAYIQAQIAQGNARAAMAVADEVALIRAQEVEIRRLQMEAVEITKRYAALNELYWLASKSEAEMMQILIQHLQQHS